jgi:DNA-binding transcriptional LysR family regulator
VIGGPAGQIPGGWSFHKDGRQPPVLPDWRREPVELNAVYSAGRAAKPAARLFTDFLIEALKSG